MVNKGPRGRRAAARPSVPEESPERPKDEAVDPLDFEKLPRDMLRKYRQKHALPVPSSSTLNGYMLGGSIGKRTWSAKNLQRAPKPVVAELAKEHFLADSVRESETIVDFFYAIQNKDKLFKVQFR